MDKGLTYNICRNIRIYLGRLNDFSRVLPLGTMAPRQVHT